MPKYTEPYVAARYISKDCLEYEFNSDMSPHKVPTYNVLYQEVTTDPQTGYFQTKLPFSGGGWCKWKIERAYVSANYTDVSHLVKDAVPYGGTGLIAFINDAVQTNISEMPASNTIDFSPVIYPVLEIVEGFPKTVSLQGEVLKMRPFRLMLTPGTKWKIIFKPKLDETKMAKVTVTNGKGEWVEYPGGKIDKGTQLVDFRFMYMNMK